jgi:hypothetical protein
MSEQKKLGSISYITDTDVGFERVGEIEGGFDEIDLGLYLQHHPNGRKELLTQLGYMAYQVHNTYLKIHGEGSSEMGMDQVQAN